MIKLKHQVGFTIIEIMIAIAVIAIITAVATPSLNGFIARNELAGSVNSLLTGINLARSEAITRTTVVSICPSNNGATCTDGRWQDGWLVFTDANNDQNIDGGDILLQVENGAGASTVAANNSGNLTSGLGFNSRGSISNFAIGQTGNITLTHSEVIVGRQVDISFSGQVTTQEVIGATE